MNNLRWQEWTASLRKRPTRFIIQFAQSATSNCKRICFVFCKWNIINKRARLNLAERESFRCRFEFFCELNALHISSGYCDTIEIPSAWTFSQSRINTLRVSPAGLTFPVGWLADGYFSRSWKLVQRVFKCLTGDTFFRGSIRKRSPRLSPVIGWWWEFQSRRVARLMKLNWCRLSVKSLELLRESASASIRVN